MNQTNLAAIHGSCDDRFSRVAEAFESNFAEHGEIGAAVSVWYQGRKAVDLWGGWRDAARSRPWEEDTIVCMMSVGKQVSSICVHLLIERGAIDPEAPIADYWPEFAGGGKEAIKVVHSLSHHDGLIYADKKGQPGDIYIWNNMVRNLEAQSPSWPPGTKGAYNSMNYGFIIGELVRRVTGNTIGTFIHDEIAGPLGIDYHVGLNDDLIARVTDIIPNPDSTTLKLIQDPSSNLARAWKVLPEGGLDFNDDTVRRIELPSGNGHGNARAMARLYAFLAGHGELEGLRLCKHETVDFMREQQWENACGLTGRPYRMGRGFFLNMPGYLQFGDNKSAFAGFGAGGATTIADPEAGLAFSYSPNFMCAGETVGEKGQALINAAFSSL